MPNIVPHLIENVAYATPVDGNIVLLFSIAGGVIADPEADPG
jgi:hypothetical protein